MATEFETNYQLQFWTNYYPEDETKKYDYFSWASNKAYLDMNRTMTFRETTNNQPPNEVRRIEKNRRGWCDDVTKDIQSDFRSGPEKETYDGWHKALCEKICGHYSATTNRLVDRGSNNSTGLTFGQAQKWLNMTMKYLWLLGRLGGLSKLDQDIMDNIEDNLHVPLDSYIIKYINQTQNRVNRPENGLRSQPPQTLQFAPEWSKIDKNEQYYKLQQWIRDNLVTEEKKNPLEWELEHWHKALKAYGDTER